MSKKSRNRHRWRGGGFGRFAALPISFLYRAVIAARNRKFDRFGGKPAGVPVISVGNITTGGTGKTPMVVEIVRRLRGMGRRPVILTRGYGAERGQLADEVREFHEAVADTPVIVNADRVAGAATAVRDFGGDCCVMDDGFQHRRLHRDLNIVLVDALDPWGGARLLPAGRLREPLSSLSRADLCIVTRFNQVEHNTGMVIWRDVEQRAGAAPVLRAEVCVHFLHNRDGREVPSETLRGRRVLAVCGLGNPATLSETLSSLGATVESLAFRDHRKYTPADVRMITDRAAEFDTDLIVTTRKDWVKLAPLLDGTRSTCEWLRLDIGVNILDPANVLDNMLLNLFSQPSG
ncbi:MAG: tetraacyldisaccharide 4'-kinase [Phycisphaerae bacterium]